MTTLHELLARASEGDARPVPVSADLGRARTALRRHRTRRTSAAALVVIAVAASGWGAASISGGPLNRSSSATAPSPSAVSPARQKLVPAGLEAGPYLIGKVPEGWELQADDPAVLAPSDGSVSADPHDLVGKLVVIFAVNPVGKGTALRWNGEAFVARGSGDTAVLARATRDDEPRGSLLVQYPVKSLPQRLVLEFAAAVTVTHAASRPDRDGADSAARTAVLLNTEDSTSVVGAPTILPASASHKRSWALPGGAVHHEYRLVGLANADTVAAQRLASDPRSLAVHPATYLSVDFVPHPGKKPEVPGNPAYSNTEAVDINGADGTLTTMKNGLGVIRLDWIDGAGNYHVVMVDRLQTSAGLSGLSATQILAVGRSI